MNCIKSIKFSSDNKLEPQMLCTKVLLDVVPHDELFMRLHNYIINLKAKSVTTFHYHLLFFQARIMLFCLQICMVRGSPCPPSRPSSQLAAQTTLLLARCGSLHDAG